MKITVVNGTEKRGVTHKLKEAFLDEMSSDAQVTEFWLPRDCAGFCSGCTSCFFAGEAACKDAEQVSAIVRSLRDADLIVMTTPAYVMHATGAMKSFLDHLAFMWMPHRPAPEMFGKRAVVIAQCLGAGAKSAARDIKDSLSWWGVSQIDVLAGRLMSEIVWERLPEKTRTRLVQRARKLARRLMRLDYSQPAKSRLPVRAKFLICRQMRKGLRRSHPKELDQDTKYWEQQGWLDGARPWKKE